MALKMVIGLPGSGKSYYATRKIAAWLLREWRSRPNRPRQLVCSVELDMHAMAIYLDKWGCPLISCITKFQKRDPRLRTFWRERGNRWRMKVTAVPDASGYIINNFKAPQYDYGVCYWIDEGQFLFRARDYQKFSGEAQDYLSYHEHLMDMIFIITQDVKQMDVSFTRLCEEFIWIVNGCRVRFFGWFRGSKQFMAHHYWSLPQKGMAADQTEPVRFNKEIAGLYKSSEGGDRGENDRGGLHWGWLAGAFGCVMLLCGCGYYGARGQLWRLPVVGGLFERPPVKAVAVTGVWDGAHLRQQPTGNHKPVVGSVASIEALRTVPQIVTQIVERVRPAVSAPPAPSVPYRPDRVISWMGGNGTYEIRTEFDVWQVKDALCGSDRLLWNGVVIRRGDDWRQIVARAGVRR